MADVAISPRRGKGEPVLSDLGILCINPGEAAVACRVAKQSGGKRYRLFNSNLYQVPATDRTTPFFTAGPAIGAPMAVLALEKLVALGAKRILVYGWCGSLTESLAVGDILLPTRALSEEGTSVHYPLSSRAEASQLLLQPLTDRLQAENIKVKTGTVWTTDAPYRETWDKIRRYSSQSVLGVEMEFAALCTVAAFRDVELAAMLLVSDELWRQPWQPGYTHKKFKKKCRLMLEILFDFCRTFPS
jgi:uridine phosphorylase